MKSIFGGFNEEKEPEVKKAPKKIAGRKKQKIIIRSSLSPDLAKLVKDAKEGCKWSQVALEAMKK